MTIIVRNARVLRALAKLEGGTEKALKIAAQIVGEELEAESKTAFREQADPMTAKPWAKRKGNRDPERALLIQTGALRRGVNASVKQISKDRAVIEGAVVGPAADYALQHQEGDQGRNLVARPYMGLNEADWKRVDGRITKAVEKEAVG